MRRRRRGGLYVAILGAALTVSLIGLTALLTARVQGRASEGSTDAAEALLYAQSAIEMGLLLTSAENPNWRSDLEPGLWLKRVPLGSGSISLEVYDPTNNLGDSPLDPLTLVATGYRGPARALLAVTLAPDIRPLEALRTCLHASGNVTVQLACTATATGAALSTNGSFLNQGVVFGNVEAASYSGLPPVSGTVRTPAPARSLPDPGVFDLYAARATLLPASYAIEEAAIGPDYTPYGVKNADGVYLIDTDGDDLMIRDTRIFGTLLVRCRPGKLVIANGVLFHPFRPDYPVLLVDGEARIGHRSTFEDLSESVLGTNFNPRGVPYNNRSDTDLSDTYPNEIRGLIYVRGALTLRQSARIRGVILCDGTVSLAGSNEIIHDSAYYIAPPEGFTEIVGMKISPGSWRRQTTP